MNFKEWWDDGAGKPIDVSYDCAHQAWHARDEEINFAEAKYNALEASWKALVEKLATQQASTAKLLDGLKWAESFIEKNMPYGHNGRDSWLLNYGVGESAKYVRLNDPRFADKADYPVCGAVVGTEELAAIKAAERQAGYDEGHAAAMIGDGVSSAELSAYKRGVEEGKQAGRAELEKELMEQEPRAYVVLGINDRGIIYDHAATLDPEADCSLEEFWGGNEPLYSNPFPQQKPLSVEKIISMDIRGTADEALRFARAIEAAHGITGEKK